MAFLYQEHCGSKDERRELGQEAIAMTWRRGWGGGGREEGEGYGELDKGCCCKKEKSYGFSIYFKNGLYFWIGYE